MFGMHSCDELRGYLDVKVPSAARKRGLLIQWKAWRRQWLVVRRFLVSSDPTLGNGERTAILGRRLEVRLTGDSSPSSVSAPCPVVVVEEWQEDALVCPTQSRSHPFAFGLFPQPGCEPIIFLSGRSEEESRRWLASIRSLLVPPFRPVLFRLSSHSNSNSDDNDMTPMQSSPSSSSTETCRNSCLSSKNPHICFPPLPPLPSRCHLRRRSSVEALEVPSALTDRRRSLSDSEITVYGMEHHHRHRKCQRNITDSETFKTDTSLSEDYDHHHIYAGIVDSGVCSSMSNDSRSYLSSSSSSCSSSSGLYAYATASDGGFKSYLRQNSTDYPANCILSNESPHSKVEDSTVLGGKVASSLITAGIGLMLSTPVSLEGVPDFSQLPSNGKEGVNNGGMEGRPHQEGVEMDTDRRESIASGIYEEIQEDQATLNTSVGVEEVQRVDEQHTNSNRQSPPPLPPRSPSQFIPICNGRQRNLAWFLGVHRHSNSCPASDDDDDETSRESSPFGVQDGTSRRLQRKISEPFGIQPQHDDSSTVCSYSRKSRKNLESFLGVLEFGSRNKEMCKQGMNILNKSLGALDINGKAKGEKDSPERPQNCHSRGRTYTDSAGTRNVNLFTFKETKRCSSSDAMFARGCSTVPNSPSDVKQDKNQELPSSVMGNNNMLHDLDVASQKKESSLVNTESPEIVNERERCSHNKSPLPPSPLSIEIAEFNENSSPENSSLMERCNSLSSSCDKSFQPDRIDTPERNSQSPKSPISLMKRLPWMKPGNALMRLLSKEPNKQQDSPSLKDRTRQVINRSLETLSKLSFSPMPTDDYNDGDNLTVGGSNFYRSATCSGADMEMERNNALRRGTGAISIDDNQYSRSYDRSLGRQGVSDGYSRSYESSTVGRRKVRKKPPSNLVSDDIWVRETDDKYGGQLDELVKSAWLLKDSSICEYHRSCLQESGEVSCHTLEDIERLANQEMLCERFCIDKGEDEPDYIPMRPLVNEEQQDQHGKLVSLSSDQVDYITRPYKRVSVVPEEDLYMCMEGATLPKQSTGGEGCIPNNSPDSLKQENSSSNLIIPSDGDIYLPMEGRKSTLEELAQR